MMGTRAEIVTVRCEAGCATTADVVVANPGNGLGVWASADEWNTLPPGWFERLPRLEQNRPRAMVCSRFCLLRVLEHEAKAERTLAGSA